MSVCAPRSTPAALTAWVVLGTLALPLLQLAPLDFERSALFAAFGLPLTLGWRLWTEEALAWLSAPRLRLWIGGSLTLVLASTACADQPAPAFVQLANEALLVALALLCAALHRADPGHGRTLLLGLAGSGLIGVASLSVPWIFHAHPRETPTQSFIWLYAHIRHAGLHLLAATSLVALAIATGSTRRTRLVLFTLGVPLTTALLWLGGRTPLLGLALSALYAAWYLGRPYWRSLVCTYLALLTLGTLLSLLFWTHNPDLGLWRMAQSTATATNVNELSSYRVDIWRACASFIAQDPWLGHGPDAYRFLIPKMPGQQPHNFMVQWALALGIPAALLGLLGFGLLLRFRRDATALPPARSVVVTSMVLIAALAGAGLADGALYHVLCTHALAIGAGLALSRFTPPPATPRLIRARPLLLIPSLGLAGVLGLHAYLHHQLTTELPPLHGPPPRLLRAFPSSTFCLNRWIDHWAQTDPVQALEWARWAQPRSAYAWIYHESAARTLVMLGRIDQAQIEITARNRCTPTAFVESIIKK